MLPERNWKYKVGKKNGAGMSLDIPAPQNEQSFLMEGDDIHYPLSANDC